jgi:hypothetical protein
MEGGGDMDVDDDRTVMRDNGESDGEDQMEVDEQLRGDNEVEVDEEVDQDDQPADGDRNGNDCASISSATSATSAAGKSLIDPPVVSQRFLDAYESVEIPVMKSYELYSPDGSSNAMISTYMNVLLYQPTDVPKRPDIWQTVVYKWAELEEAWNARNIEDAVCI